MSRLAPIQQLQLTEIGIPFSTDFSDSNIQFGSRECFRAFQEMPRLENHTIKIQKVAGELSFVPRGSFTLPTGTYEILTRFGDPSNFGAVYKIAKRNDPEKRLYILKAQRVKPRDAIAVLQELAIQHILYETTKHESSPYVPKIHYVSKLQPTNAPEIYLFSIQEFLTGGTLNQFCTDNEIETNRNFTQLKPIFLKLAEKLANLWAVYKFNHCDLHASNVMLHAGHVFLVDFGFAILQRGNFFINVQLHLSKEGRDMTHLLTYMVTDSLISLYEPFIWNVLESAYEIARREDPENPHFVIQTMFDNPTYDNPSAFPLTILENNASDLRLTNLVSEDGDLSLTGLELHQGATGLAPGNNMMVTGPTASEIAYLQMAAERQVRAEYNRYFPSQNRELPTGLLIGALGVGAIAYLSQRGRGVT